MGLDLTKKINRIVVDGEEAIVVGVPNLQEKTTRENGEIVADTGYDGLSKVIVEVPSDNPLIATTDEEMTILLVENNSGKVVKFTGETGTYETDTYYLIEGV